jgi:hypothetical protein
VRNLFDKLVEISRCVDDTANASAAAKLPRLISIELVGYSNRGVTVRGKNYGWEIMP